MQSLKDLISLKPVDSLKKRPPTKLWDLCEQIAKLTGEKPSRFLRIAKKDEHACLRAMDSLKELPTKRNPGAYFCWLVKHYSL